MYIIYARCTHICVCMYCQTSKSYCTPIYIAGAIRYHSPTVVQRHPPRPVSTLRSLRVCRLCNLYLGFEDLGSMTCHGCNMSQLQYPPQVEQVLPPLAFVQTPV